MGTSITTLQSGLSSAQTELAAIDSRTDSLGSEVALICAALVLAC